MQHNAHADLKDFLMLQHIFQDLRISLAGSDCNTVKLCPEELGQQWMINLLPSCQEEAKPHQNTTHNSHEQCLAEELMHSCLTSLFIFGKSLDVSDCNCCLASQRWRYPVCGHDQAEYNKVVHGEP